MVASFLFNKTIFVYNTIIMPPKKRLMNDMMPVKKTALPKQSLPVQKKVSPALLKPPKTIRYEEPEEEYDELEEDFSPIRNQRPSIAYRDDTVKKKGGFVWFIALVCSIALTLGVGGLFTEARIDIIPKSYQGSVDMSLILPQVKTATKTFTEERIVPAIGVSDKESYATGTVRFYNAGPVKTIPKGSVIVSIAKKEYVTNKAVTVPSVKAKVLGQVDVVVTAKLPGDQSNGGLDDFTFVTPSKNTAGITIRSVTPMTGGTSGQDAIADPALVAAAAESLKTQFTRSDILIKRMSEEVPETSVVLPIAFPEHSPIITTEANHADGVHVIAKETIAIVLVDRNDIARKIGDALNAPEDVKLTLKDFDGLTVTTNSITAGMPIPSSIQVRITGNGTVSGDINSEQIITKVKGSYRKTVRQLLIETPEIESFKITMRPFWRRSLPSSSDDISVNIK